MYRGTTPSFDISINDVDLTEVSEMWVSLGTENNPIVNKTLEDVEIDGSLVTVPLSQEDTLALKAAQKTYLQVRILLNSGEALASPMKKVDVFAIIKDGVIGIAD